MDPGPFLLPGLAVALLVAAAVAACIADRRRLRRALREAMTQRDRGLVDRCAAIRALRLAAIELRGPATTLLGHADRLCADGGYGKIGVGETCAGQNRGGQDSGRQDSGGQNWGGQDWGGQDWGGQNGAAQIGATIGAIAHQMLDLADDLQHHALADATSRVLREEPTPLAVMLRDAITVVQAGLEPSRRQWLLPPDIDTIELLADRRALAQILTRVLGNAARFSRLDDWIDISFEFDDDYFALLVADEGIGVVAAGHAGTPAPADSRGLGLGLALARVLMEAHGGALRVEAVPSVGTRVRLDFPMKRLLRAVPSTLAAASVSLPTGAQLGGVQLRLPVGVSAGAQSDAVVGGMPSGAAAGVVALDAAMGERPVGVPVGV